MSHTQGLYFCVENWNNSVSMMVMFSHVFLDLQMIILLLFPLPETSVLLKSLALDINFLLCKKWMSM